MDNKSEEYAEAMRAARDRIKNAEEGLEKAKAEEKKEFSGLMLKAENELNIKSLGGQEKWADNQESIYQKRLEVGVARGELAAAKVELSMAEGDLRIWQTNQKTMHLEMRSYKL